MLGIDVGTTNWKVIAYSLGGEPVASWTCPTKTHYSERGWAVYKPNEIWTTISAGIRKTVAQLGNSSGVKSVAVTSVGESGVLLDSEGNAIGDSIAWFDSRTAPILDFWEKEYGLYRLYEQTGFPPQYIASINKLMWIKNNEPDIFHRAKKWLCMADYIAYKLSGIMAMDYSLASRTMCFDILQKKWSEEILKTAKISYDIMPDLVSSGDRLGGISSEAQAATGLDAGTIIAAGGHDHICGALGAGVHRDGQILDSVGTAEALLLVLKQPLLNREAFESGFASGCHTVKDRYYLLGGLQTSGAAVEWMRSELGGLESGIAEGHQKDVYDRLMESARKAPVGSEGLFFLPHLRGAILPVDERSKAAWIGLRPFHKQAHLIRSIIEGLCYELRWNLEEMKRFTGVGVDSAVAIGGGTKNDLWMQSKADICNISLVVPKVEEAPTLGAAMLGAVAAGTYSDLNEAISNVHKIEKIVEPNPVNLFHFENYYKIYKDIYPALKDLNARIDYESQG